MLISTCLLIRGVYQLDHQKLGFAHDHLLTAGLVLDQAHYDSAAKQTQFVRQTVTELQQIAGTQTVAVTSDLPAAGAASVSIHTKDQPEARTNEQLSTIDVVITPDYSCPH